MGRDQFVLIHLSFQFISTWYEWKFIPGFSGYKFPRQVHALKCDGLTFEPKSTLPFDFTGGACSTNDDLIMLCFSEQEKQRCYKSRSPTLEYWWQFTLTNVSNFEHNFTPIALTSYSKSGRVYIIILHGVKMFQ